MWLCGAPGGVPVPWLAPAAWTRAGARSGGRSPEALSQRIARTPAASRGLNRRTSPLGRYPPGRLGPRTAQHADLQALSLWGHVLVRLLALQDRAPTDIAVGVGVALLLRHESQRSNVPGEDAGAALPLTP